MSATTKVEPYNLAQGFERAAITLACGRLKFFGRVGGELDPLALGEPACRLALEACKAVARDLGRGPGSTVLVVQRLRRWVNEGRVTIEDVRDVAELFDAAEDAGLPDEESVIAELTPILRRRIHREAVTASMDEFGRGGDFKKVGGLLARADRIGIADTSIGVKLGAGSFEEIARLRALERLPLGVLEVDSYLDGGLQRGGLGVLLAESGAGKSMGLAHIGGCSVSSGFFVALATLELPEGQQLARIKANITGVPINTILAPGSEERVLAQLAAMGLGPCVVKGFTPVATTIEDIRDWVKACEDDAGRQVDVLIVDYADKLGAKARTKDDASGYSQGRIVYEGLRIHAEETKTWCWTACQATRKKDKKRKLEIDDMADSIHKARVADLIVALNLRGEEEALEMLFGIVKHRTGKSRATIGPLPCEFECARIAPPILQALATDAVARLSALGPT